ncbi:MAG: SRPBCC domain-containing protein [Mucilaginibacter sp.]
MTTQDFTTTLVVDQTPKQAFNAIINTRGWWSEEIEGNTEMLNDVFDYHFEDIHTCKIKLIEVIPNKKVVWLVMENYFKFTQDVTEWTGTTISFEISEKEGKTQVVLTHHGLVPEYECYDICRDSWSNYVQGSLASLIRTGKGQPNSAGNPKTANEERLIAEKE